MQDLSALPRLGVGISCELDTGKRPGLDALELRNAHGSLPAFLEVGADVARGLDRHMLSWAAEKLPATYHFLDLNLAEAADLDAEWVARTVDQANQVGAAWLCGDAGYWHLGRRERTHELLLPPILTADAADEMSATVARLQRMSGYTVLPENPPSQVFLGDLHLLEFFGRVATDADCGLLLDAAHLAVYQLMTGRSALDGFQSLPMDRIIEVHVAGGTHRSHRGFPWVEDSHTVEPLPETWAIVEHILAHAPNLKAIVYECEHNRADEVLPVFDRLSAAFPA
jgi:uncharacterized protein